MIFGRRERRDRKENIGFQFSNPLRSLRFGGSN
jgi:hypothetical protein